MCTLRRVLSFILKHPMNKGHKLSALFRFLHWQMISSLCRKFFFVVPWIEGSCFIAKKSLTGITGNIYCGLHEFPQMAFLLHSLEQEDCFVDVGANVGSYSILAGTRKARVIAVEPIPLTFSMLKKNIGLNDNTERTVCLNLGLAEQAGTLRFTADQDTCNRILDDSEDYSGAISMVEIQTLDAIVPADGKVLLKIDTEGVEEQVLKGGRELLASSRILAIICENNQFSAVKQLCDEYGYLPYLYEPFSRTLTPAEGNEESNTIFIADPQLVMERLARAPQITWNKVSV